MALLASVGPDANPLAASYPSPLFLVNYPLFAMNVRVLTEKDWQKGRGQSSLASTIASLRLIYHTEGPGGLYRGGHLYLAHQAARDGLRLLADRCIGAVERRCCPEAEVAEPASGGASEATARRRGRRGYWPRLLAKYLIEVACYPILLSSTRSIMLRGEPNGAWPRACLWCREEGFFSLFAGLTASVLTTALDELMDVFLGACIERAAEGTRLEVTDQLLLRAAGSSVTSIFTSPVNYVAVIQRCQSSLPGLLERSPLWSTVKSLPWRGSVYQFFMFSGILLLNVKLIQLKVEAQAEDEADYDLDPDPRDRQRRAE